MSDVLFSIVMPVYNNEKYFPIAVRSILEQSYENLELIIVDDGSVDKTGMIADQIKKSDSRVKVIHQSNQWIYASFNRGIEEACGEYIYIVNSDDKLRDNSLAILCDAINRYNHPEIIWTKVIVCKCDDEQNIIEEIDINKKIREEEYWSKDTDSIDAWDNLLRSDLMVNQANLYKTSLMKKHKFRNDVYGADYLLNLEICKSINNYLILPNPIYSFYQYSSNNMNASIGKYYGYEHEMYNDFYSYEMDLLKTCNKDSVHNIDRMRKARKVNFSVEIRKILNSNLDTDDKLSRVMESSIDDLVFGVIEDFEELDARILHELEWFFYKNPVEENSKYYFLYRMLESILRYEKDEEDIKFIREGIYNELNPFNIGKAICEKIV